MTRLPPALMPLWPAAKRAHRAATLVSGVLTRRLVPGGPRAVPRLALERSADLAAVEPQAVTWTPVRDGAQEVVRDVPTGEPGGLRFWDDVRRLRFSSSVVEVRDGRLVGESAALVTPGGHLDFERSPYFGIRSWREHPVYLRPRLPAAEEVDGVVVSLASHASARNYYHSLMDALPRWGLFREAYPDLEPDRVVVGHTTRWDAQLVAMLGLDRYRLVEPTGALSLRAERLVVPSIDNRSTLAPPWVTAWLRENLPARAAGDRPRRIYVTRGDVPHTRRYVQEAALLPELERQGFVRVDPGALTVQEQIDTFAAAEVVVAPHGAGLVNLSFAPEGVRVLELFAPRYLNPGYWAIVDNVADSVYRYVVADPAEPDRPERRMNRVQHDIDLAPERVLAALEELLSTDRSTAETLREDEARHE